VLVALLAWKDTEIDREREIEEIEIE